jgi:penicillin-binding protein 2
VKQGDQVGQSGVEYTYDSALRGINGDTKFQVDAAGRPTGRIASHRQPQPGDNLRLSIDDRIQEAGQTALGSFGGLPGAFVAMNVHNGQVLGLGSYPTYDPAFFTHPILSPAQYKALVSQKTGSPLTDRAIQGQYPTGSTFKPITSLAALASHTITPSTTINDTGSFSEGGGVTLHNAGGASYGPLQLASALRVSSDVFFYHLGADMNTSDTKSGPLQKWAHTLGIGQPTGIDVPGELSGTLPTPPWLNRQHQLDPSVYDPWTYGANVNLATGQGYLEATPLQMATAYAALGNGGDIVRPHVGLQVDDPSGRVVQDINPAPQRHVNINPSYRSVILQGLHEAAQTAGGTSDAVFGNYPVPIAGKTGTAVRYPYATQSYLGPEVDQSWYVLLAPYPNPKVVIAVTIERGGFGVEAAAPAARQILDAYYAAHGRKIKSPGIPAPGTIATSGSNPY